MEMPLTRFEECWPLSATESLPELPSNLNIVTLTLTLWPINSGVLTFLPLPHLSSSLADSLPSLNLLYNSKTDARIMQDGRKLVWSIPYVSVASFFPSVKQNFIAYRSSNVSTRPECIFEIHQLWQSGFTRVYSDCCCSCSFEPEIIKIGQPSHKMYRNNILNFQESTTILNACALKKKSGNLLKAPRNSFFLSYLLLWWIELEQSAPLIQINGSVRDSVWTPEFDMKHVKKVEGHIDQNLVSVTIRMRSIVEIF